jgi:hypothetical protein
MMIDDEKIARARGAVTCELQTRIVPVTRQSGSLCKLTDAGKGPDASLPSGQPWEPAWRIRITFGTPRRADPIVSSWRGLHTCNFGR